MVWGGHSAGLTQILGRPPGWREQPWCAGAQYHLRRRPNKRRTDPNDSLVTSTACSLPRAIKQPARVRFKEPSSGEESVGFTGPVGHHDAT